MTAAARTTLERIELPPTEVFDREHIRKLEAVVVTNLFEGDPIRNVRSRQQAIEAWGHVRIPVDAEYDRDVGIGQVSAHLLARQPQLRDAEPIDETSMTMADYLALVERTGGRSKPRIAFDPPPEIASSLRIPEVCRPTANESKELTSCCFFGNRGSFSHLHFDKDVTHGLLYQVYGRKRVVVIPHGSSHKLAPLTQFSGWCLQNFTDSDREAFLAYTGGSETVIGPGEAVYLPACCWHYVDYLDDSFGLNLRFRRSNAATALANLLFPDLFMLHLAARLSDPELPESVWRPMVAELEAAAQGHDDGAAQVAAVRQAARRLCLSLDETIPDDLYGMDLEPFFPSPIPRFLDAKSPRRPTYT